MTLLRIVIPLSISFDLSTIFSENRCPLFRIMRYAPHHTKIALVWRDLSNHEIAAKFLSSAQFSLFFQPLQPGFGLAQHVLRRRAAVAGPAFHRRFDREHL